MPNRLFATLAACALLSLTGCLRDPGPAERLDAYALEGIDVSRWQEEINWGAVAADGIDFAFVKASEGETLRDPQFDHNWAAAKAAGLTRGAYHFYRANVDPEAQAANFLAALALEPGDLAPVVDVETRDGVSRAELVAGLQTFLLLVEVRTGVRPVVYTGQKFYYRHLAGHLDGYALWIARYGDSAPSVAAGTELALWQYSDRGRVAGVRGHVDLNVFLGDREAFERLRVPGADAAAERSPSAAYWPTRRLAR